MSRCVGLGRQVVEERRQPVSESGITPPERRQLVSVFPFGTDEETVENAEGQSRLLINNCAIVGTHPDPILPALA